jgi:ATP-dependent Clp endopeptidase proteolytic subunit ClpP
MSARPIEIRMAGDVVELLVYGLIGDPYGDGVTARQIADELGKNKTAKRVDVYINSPGGDVSDALAIYNALIRHRGDVNVYIDGMALSSAGFLAMSGDRIYIAENGMMMLHDPSAFGYGNAQDMRDLADRLDKVKSTIVTTYAARSGNTAETIEEWMSAETWLDANEAIEHHLADEMTEAKRIAACDLTRYRNVPAEWAGSLSAEPSASATKTESEVNSMSEDKGQNKATIDADAIKAEGEAAGVAAERERFRNLKARFDDLAFVADHFEAGSTLDEAETAWVAHRLKASETETENLSAEVETLKAQNAELLVAANAAAGKPAEGKAVAFVGDSAAANAADTDADPSAEWENEWNKSAELRREFQNKKTRYLAFKRAETRGAIRIRD